MPCYAEATKGHSMMKKILLFACLTALFAHPSNARATASNDTESGWTASGTKIRVVMPGYTTYTFVNLYANATTTTPLSCSLGSWRISRSHPSHDLLYNAAMAAYLSGRSVIVSYE